jgi:hypothetical protein
MKTAALVLSLVMLATPVFAQNHPFTVNFDVGNDEELSRNVMNRVTKQIVQVLADQMAKQCAHRRSLQATIAERSSRAPRHLDHHHVYA